MKSYPHGTIPDQQMETLTKVKDHIILKIQSEFVNESNISESIHKGMLFDLRKDIPIKRIPTEDEPWLVA